MKHHWPVVDTNWWTLKSAMSPASFGGAVEQRMPASCHQAASLSAQWTKSMMDATKREREFLAAQGPRLGEAGATVVYFDKSKSRACSFYPAGTRRGCRQLSLICVLLNLRRARLIDPIDAALDEPLVPRRFPESTPLQHFQEPCEWQTRWQMSSPSSRRPIPHGGLSRG
jgi:hypothetical protein